MPSIVDKPKESHQDDLLEIEKYTNGLVKFIQTSNTPITIGVQGEWGSGKTSLLNTIREDLCTKEGSLSYAIWLNTWEYSLLSEPDETLIKIILGLINQIGLLSKKTSKESLSTLSRLGKSLLNKASKNDGILGVVADVVNDVNVINSDNTISELREELQNVIDKAIETSNKKSFIFFIDDLDRLDPTVAVSILELIKNLFDLKNCVFVLAIDYGVVVKGLQSKFGKMTEENEWEFRAFFDKIIQLPFSMPISGYNISKYLQALLVDVNYFSKEDLANEENLDKISEIVNLSVGTNPRALKRLANSVSLIEIIRGEQDITAQERIIEFALICIQIAYPTIYTLIQKESNFTTWNDNFVYGIIKNKKIDLKDLDALKESEEFDEEWEQNLWKICQISTFLKERSFSISKLLNFIKDNTPNIKDEDFGDTIDRLLNMSSVTSFSTNSVNTVKKLAKTNYGKPIKDYIIDIYNKLDDNIETTRAELEKMVFDEIKRSSGLEIKSNTKRDIIRTVIVNDKVRCHYGVNETNMDKLNLFYYVDESNKNGLIKKFLPDTPPVGYKIYYREKKSKVDKEIVIT
jgi:ABC-type phosphonate transport system ATPase subunit